MIFKISLEEKCAPQRIKQESLKRTWSRERCAFKAGILNYPSRI